MAMIAVATIPQNHLPVGGAVMLFFFMALQRSVCDLLTEAKYAESISASPESGPDLLTFVWGGIEFFALIGLLLIGPILEHYGPRRPLLILIPFASLILVPAGLNYLKERRQVPAEVAEKREQLWRENKEVGVVGTSLESGSWKDILKEQIKGRSLWLCPQRC